MSVLVRQDPLDPNRWFLDFDPAAPGGKGGASVLLDPVIGLASVDGIHRNRLLSKRSSGRLLAEGLQLIGMPQPAVLEMYNADRSTRKALLMGGNGEGTLLGNLLEDAVQGLGGAITRWEPVASGLVYHLRVHVAYP